MKSLPVSIRQDLKLSFLFQIPPIDFSNIRYWQSFRGVWSNLLLLKDPKTFD